MSWLKKASGRGSWLARQRAKGEERAAQLQTKLEKQKAQRERAARKRR